MCIRDRYATMEEFWRAQVVDAAAEAAGREALLKRALAAQYATPAAAESGLVAHLLATADQLLVNVDVDPWLGMQAAGGISSGQNVFGKALMALRAELREQQRVVEYGSASAQPTDRSRLTSRIQMPACIHPLPAVRAALLVGAEWFRAAQC